MAHVLVDARIAVIHGGKAESLLHEPTTALADIPSLRGRHVSGRCDCSCEAGDVVWVNQGDEIDPTRDLAMGGYVRQHDGTTALHRFQNGDRQSLSPRR